MTPSTDRSTATLFPLRQLLSSTTIRLFNIVNVLPDWVYSLVLKEEHIFFLPNVIPASQILTSRLYLMVAGI